MQCFSAFSAEEISRAGNGSTFRNLVLFVTNLVCVALSS